MSIDLDARVLRYFIAVAEELNFSRAAERLHISQPPLSHAIKQLEAGLGVTLFARTSRQVELTTAGRVLYKEALFLLRRHSDVKNLIHRVGEGLQGQIKIGFVGSMIYRDLSRALRQCKERYPDVEQLWLEMNSADQIELVERGGLDIGIIHDNPVSEPINAINLTSEPFVVCVPQSHPLSSDSTVSLSDLQNDDFIVFSRSLSPRYYEILLSMYLKAGFYPRVRLEARHWLSVVSLVSQGLGVSVVPQCLSRAGVSGVHYLHFDHTLRSNNTLIWSANNELSTVNNYVSLLRDYYAVSPDSD